jgi:hypothetical protein
MRAFIFAVFVLPVGVLTTGCEGLINELPTTPDPVFVTETFTGTLTVNGAQTHQFFTLATGPVTATLTSLGDTPPEKVGFSMGTLSGSTCSIVLANDNAVVSTVLLGTVASLQGTLCMRIHDVGALSGPVDYTFTVNHP